jgi:hypothetical protein
MFGAAISGDARHPNIPAVWLSLFLMCLAIVYFFPRPPQTERPALSSSRQKAELLILYTFLVVEFVCFRPVGNFLLERTGGSGDVGPVFPFYIFAALLPAFLLCGTVMTLLYFRTATGQPRARGRLLFGLLSANVVFYLAFTAFYYAQLAG